MNCDFCGEDLEDQGLLITTERTAKDWTCSGCFVVALIKGRADIIHHWGFETDEPEEEQEPTEE